MAIKLHPIDSLHSVMGALREKKMNYFMLDLTNKKIVLTVHLAIRSELFQLFTP